MHLVATAGGGFVAFDFALSFPARLRSLVVADSIGGVRDKEILDLETRIRPQRWVDIEKQSRPSRPERLDFMPLGKILRSRCTTVLDQFLEQLDGLLGVEFEEAERFKGAARAYMRIVALRQAARREATDGLPDALAAAAVCEFRAGTARRG